VSGHPQKEGGKGEKEGAGGRRKETGKGGKEGGHSVIFTRIDVTAIAYRPYTQACSG